MHLLMLIAGTYLGIARSGTPLVPLRTQRTYRAQPMFVGGVFFSPSSAVGRSTAGKTSLDSGRNTCAEIDGVQQLQSI